MSISRRKSGAEAVAGVLRGSSNESDGFAGAMVHLEVLAGRQMARLPTRKGTHKVGAKVMVPPTRLEGFCKGLGVWAIPFHGVIAG